MEFNFLIYEWEDRQLSPELSYYPYLMNPFIIWKFQSVTDYFLMI